MPPPITTTRACEGSASAIQILPAGRVSPDYRNWRGLRRPVDHLLERFPLRWTPSSISRATSGSSVEVALMERSRRLDSGTSRCRQPAAQEHASVELDWPGDGAGAD